MEIDVIREPSDGVTLREYSSGRVVVVGKGFAVRRLGEPHPVAVVGIPPQLAAALGIKAYEVVERIIHQGEIPPRGAVGGDVAVPVITEGEGFCPIRGGKSVVRIDVIRRTVMDLGHPVARHVVEKGTRSIGPVERLKSVEPVVGKHLVLRCVQIIGYVL